jgi:hypothetical protein
MSKITILFTDEEQAVLEVLARQQVRPVKEQVRFLVRAEAERQGLWPVDDAARPATERQGVQAGTTKVVE